MNEPWARPKTNKLYLHPPLAERICLMCPDFKLLSLSLLDNGTHVGQPGVGIIFLHGDKAQFYDMEKTEFEKINAGQPVYTMKNSEGFDVSCEAFCDFERNPTIYFKVTLSNPTERPLHDFFGIMPRSGQEKYMLNQHQESYSPYQPNGKNWFMLKRTWKEAGKLFAQSDMGFLRLTCDDGVDLQWLDRSFNGHAFEASDYFRAQFTLEAKEEKHIYGVLRAESDVDEISGEIYCRQKAKALEKWQGILGKIKVKPNTEDKKYTDVFYHLAMQCMQMLARYKGSELITPRQGDVGRFIWPYEGAQIITILDRIGLSDYTAQALDCYCKRWFISEGEDRGKIKSNAGWDNFTGSVIWGMSNHLIYTKSKKDFEYFLPYLTAMRDWIQKMRTQERSAGYEGIFPSGKGSDWADVAQFWTFTDSHNVMGLEAMCQALQIFQSDEYEKTRQITDDYRHTLENIRDSLYKGHENDDMYILPHELGVDFEDSENYSYYTDGAPYLLYTGFIEYGSKMMEQMENFFVKRGQFEKGLTGRMTSCSSMWDEAYFGGYGDVWYTMQSETYWVKAWCGCGQRDKALATLDAMLYYGMTEQYVVSERYCSINPRYSPWQPNGSGSARGIEMLLEVFKQ